MSRACVHELTTFLINSTLTCISIQSTLLFSLWPYILHGQSRHESATGALSAQVTTCAGGLQVQNRSHVWHCEQNETLKLAGHGVPKTDS